MTNSNDFVTDGHELYAANSPFYSSLWHRYGDAISYESARRIARSHGIELEQLFADGDLNTENDIVNTMKGPSIRTVSLVMAMGY